MILNPGITVKTIAILQFLWVSVFALLAQAPATQTPAPAPPAAVPTSDAERDEMTRKILDQIYAQSGKTNPPSRTLPTRLNAPTNPATPRTAIPLPGVPSATPAPTTVPPPPTGAVPTPPTAAVPSTPIVPTPPAKPATASATPTAASASAPNTNRPSPRATAGFPIPPAPGTTPPVPGVPATPNAAPPSPVATPIIPAIPNPNAPAPNVQGAVPGVAAGAGARPANPEDEVFPPGLIKFSEADLSQVLEIYQELTGRTVLKPNSLPQTKITIRSQTQLTRAEAVQALDSILSMNGVTMVPQGDKFVKALAEGQANQAGKKFDDLPWQLLPESGTIVTYIVQLTNAAPQEVATVLQQFAKLPGNSILAVPSTSMLVLRDYAENVKRMLELIEKLDVVPQQEFVDVVIPIKYALAGDIAQVLGSLTAGGGGGTTTVGRQQTRTGLTGSGGFGAGGAGGIPGQPGYNPNNPFGQQQLGGAAAGGLSSAGAGRSSFAQRLNQIVNRAAGATGSGGDFFILTSAKIIADERTNSLLIFASKADLATISNIIDKLDVVLAQVLIEAIVMEVKVGNNLNYGFSYVQTQPTTIGDVLLGGAGAFKGTAFTGADSIANLATNASGGFTYIAKFMNFDATMTAIAGDSRINIVSRPRIQTSHAVEANLFVGQTRPYVTGSYTYFGGGPQTQFQQQQIGLTLSVLPLINAEGLVVMDIRVKVQNIGENIPIDATFSVPETIDREAAAKVAVRDRETIMLGGFISKQRNITKSGIPLLKDIPVLGALFRSTKDDDSRIELITLIRPTVLPNPKDAAVFAAEQRRQLPAVRAAERDFNEDTARRLKKEDDLQERETRKLFDQKGLNQ